MTDSDIAAPPRRFDDGATDEPLARALSERYLTYALSTIMHRALPDARDGLKPVHRRLLYAMRQLKLDPKSGFKKSARVVGDVIGKYHPHGDQAVYDALVRLAQEFSVRYPLIDGQGNFGNIDGDSAAAMRYTEARLTAMADLMMQGLDEDAVDFRDTYDGEESEPEVLPAAAPNLLANGAQGIAVGMAASIPPHNMTELCDALLHLIKHPDADAATLVQYVPGPDFPTGGVMIEPPESILQAYQTGRGGFRLRARWEVEELPRGLYQIIITETPYQVQKSRLIEKIAELVTSKKLPLLADVRDESAEDVRVALEPKTRSVNPWALMEALFKQTDLEVRVPLNMNVLNAGRAPEVLSLKAALQAWLDHRRTVLLRRAAHRLNKIDTRIEVVEGYLIAFLNLDRLIEILRAEEEPKPVMIAELGVNDAQAEAILNMRLRALRRLEETQLCQERDALLKEREDLRAVQDSEKQQWAKVAKDVRDLKKRYSGPAFARRTSIEAAPKVEAASMDALIEREPVTVICSEKGWIRAMKGHLPLDGDYKYKDGDGPRFLFHAETTDKLLAFSTAGKFFTLGCDKLPGGRSMGEPVRLMVDLGEGAAIVALFPHAAGARYLVATSDGRGFVAPGDSLLAQTRSGKQALNVSDGAQATVCKAIPPEADAVAVVGNNRKLLVFDLAELPEMARGKGTILQKYRDGGLSDAAPLTLTDGLRWLDPAGRTRLEANLTEWRGKRGSAGRMAPRGFPRDNTFSAARKPA